MSQSTTAGGGHSEVYPDAFKRLEYEAIRNRRSEAGISKDLGEESAARLPDSSEEMPTSDAVGLALSGGGIRSATFALGFLQALADAKLLRHVDYLSTVSGGGYVGAFLGRLYTRQPIKDQRGSDFDENEYRKRFSKRPAQEDCWAGFVEHVLHDRCSRPMAWLRENGRYLSPNGSGDALLGLGIAVRNWASIQVVLVLYLLSTFLLVNILRFGCEQIAGRMSDIQPGMVWWSPILWVAMAVVAIAVVPLAWAYWLVLHRETVKKSSELGWSGWVLHYLPWIAHGALIFVMVVWLVARAVALTGMPLIEIGGRVAILDAASIVLFVLASFAVFWRGYAGMSWYQKERRQSQARAAEQKEAAEEKKAKRVEETRAESGGGTRGDDRSGSPTTADPEAERDAFLRNMLSRWLRSGLTITGLLLALFLVDSVGQTVYAYLSTVSLGDLAAAAGSAAAAILVVVLSSQKIGTRLSAGPQGRRPAFLLDAVVHVVALGLCFAALVLISSFGHAITWGGKAPVGDPGAPLRAWFQSWSQEDGEAEAEFLGQARIEDIGGSVQIRLRRPTDGSDAEFADGVAWWWLVPGFFLTFLFSLGSGHVWPFINRSTYQPLYGARLARAYLGASNPQRWRPTDGAVTEVVSGDGIDMHEYQPHANGGPLHLINLTINETVDGRSQIEQRDRKGHAMAVGPCGVSASVRHHALWRWQVPFESPPPTETLFAEQNREAAEQNRAAEEVPERYQMFTRREATVIDQNKKPWSPIAAEGLRVEQWVGISGAAFSTGTGARTSLGLSLLTGMFNIRLGYWWNSGVPPEERTAKTETRGFKRLGRWITRALPVQMHLLDEFTARFHGPAAKHWYISDGGHFENMGVYELIRRQLPWIVICDAEQDRDYTYHGLANLIRKARTDFGTEIEFMTDDELDEALDPCIRPLFGTLEQLRRGKWSEEPVHSPLVHRFFPRRRRRVSVDATAPGCHSLAHAALAKVYYDAGTMQNNAGVPPPAAGKSDERNMNECEPVGPQASHRQRNPDAVIIYVKPTLSGDEPADVLQYYHEHLDFPHQMTVDQYFDEEQWESYRRLGEHIGERLFVRPGSASGNKFPSEWIKRRLKPCCAVKG